VRALALLVAWVLLAGCDARRATVPPAERDGEPLSEPLLAALGQAKSLHHIADLRLADGDHDGAVAALSSILTIRFPAGAPEAEETLLDARARLAKVYLGLGRLDDAGRVVDEGLAAPSRESFFLANLHTVAGEVHEARARALEAVDAAAARAERRAAVEAYERSIAINRRVQEKLWKEAPP
jgi:tetratricopeptide (TPR) repeat protein